MGKTQGTKEFVKPALLTSLDLYKAAIYIIVEKLCIVFLKLTKIAT